MRFLFVDRIVHSSPGQFIHGVKHITSDDFYLTKDSGGNACFIPSLIGETLGQLAAWNVMDHNDFVARPVAGVVAKAQLHRPAYVGETLLLESFIDALDDSAVQYHSIARVGEETVFSIEGALGPLLPMHNFIDNALIRQQYKEIFNPGDWTTICHNKPPKSKFLSETGPVVAPMTFDAIISSTPGVSLVAEKKITAAAPYFPDHFPNKPVLPMTVLLECKLNLAHFFVAEAGYADKYQVKELRKIKMNEFVVPGDVLTCQVKVKQHTEEELVLSYRSEVNAKRVCVVDVVLIAKR